MGALLHLMDWQKVQLGLELTVAAALLLGSFGWAADRWNGSSSDHAERAAAAAGD